MPLILLKSENKIKNYLELLQRLKVVLKLNKIHHGKKIKTHKVVGNNYKHKDYYLEKLRLASINTIVGERKD